MSMCIPVSIDFYDFLGLSYMSLSNSRFGYISLTVCVRCILDLVACVVDELCVDVARQPGESR